MPTNHTAKDGDCLSSLSARYGFGSYKTIYDDGNNATLKKNRPSPNLLAPGDIVSIPDKAAKEADAKTAEQTKFKVKLPKAEMQLHLRGLVGEKLKGAKYELSVQHASKGFNKADVLDGEGLLKVAIPADATGASVEIELPPPPAPAAPPADGLVVPPEVFTLKVEAAHPSSTFTATKKLLWTITLGTLGPIGPASDAANKQAFVRGAQRRLANLGYKVSTAGAMDAKTEEALVAFQDEHGLSKEPSALTQKTADQLAKTHDKGET